MFFGRRITFAILVLATQLLLIALAITWIVHLILIAKLGAIYFVEENPIILYTEIAATILITLFAIIVFALQYKRLGERRRGDEKKKGS